ncbi:peptidase [Thalassobacter stenotrophicus]|uniref:Proteasome endopeptidase complex, archaeal, beta subunit n=2 Tax=Thalassobacter stenotrophicus TaxID=266809 RepID=A0A0P1FPC2_9RHOB|nr:peptidase [Thalassobacter stenotrophicus]PVZ49047.1 peptidase [Thalassobacter stenotrophicus]CUH61968.1 proteasome endopeptidase complex, archaeal, beta subunit [Thalassobacter stenotrophicus]SHI37939.1 putative proteasome-type protease [Thalassobacter stenotrophicus DSM 16310]
MTYCVGMKLDKGLVFMSDTRTNAGVDNISSSRKMFNWTVPGERSITIMTAGNLATTQAMISLLQERSEAVENRAPGILQQPTMFQIARLVGSTLKEVILGSAAEGPESADTFAASVIVGGQIRGGQPTIFLVYPEGNFIEVTADAPFFQIGETKYGKPILVRAYEPTLDFPEALKLLLVSFDSTVKANISVAPPFDVTIYKSDSFEAGQEMRINYEDPIYQSISQGWGDALRSALDQLPNYPVEE